MDAARANLLNNAAMFIHTSPKEKREDVKIRANNYHVLLEAQMKIRDW